MAWRMTRLTPHVKLAWKCCYLGARNRGKPWSVARSGDERETMSHSDTQYY